MGTGQHPNADRGPAISDTEQGAAQPVVRVGEFAVIRRSYHDAAVKVSKVTAKQFKASGEWSSRDHTYQIADVKFCGDEATAKLLVERLTSSAALCSDERQKAYDRRTARDAKLIEAANTAPGTGH